MAERYNRKMKTFQTGERVAVRIPRIDRACTDLHRLPCIIVQRQGKKHYLYRLRCKHGVLDTLYRESELEAYSGSLQVEAKGWEMTPRISLRQAAKKSNPDNAFYGTHCGCKKGCNGKKCSCRQVGKPCSSRCHSGSTCSNQQSASTCQTSRVAEKDHGIPGTSLTKGTVHAPIHYIFHLHIVSIIFTHNST